MLIWLFHDVCMLDCTVAAIMAMCWQISCNHFNILSFIHSLIHSCLRKVKYVGLFHELPVELQDSLVITSKMNAPESHQKFRELLWMQHGRRFEKKQASRDKKVEGEMAQVMANSYLWQK